MRSRGPMTICLTDAQAAERMELRARSKHWGLIAGIYWGALKGEVVVSGSLEHVETIMDGLLMGQLCDAPVIDVPRLIPGFYWRQSAFRRRAVRDRAWTKQIREIIWNETGEFVRLT